ncbi:hypothetical protein BDP81DRAFT_66304 [Colletotrichum phormii]|uniref:Uncharacterized protein n=1 Tax=Colletotrichum phormii TaxID=359342 RepID=A0AAI9ZLH1_9PEZI|nr:uncharacterized protein BDP81DRAFT_66304 [Colletotrichum phormii]KAK1634153.1 hypothetical protein BDP81DRAFT_66304 [Colletotrichum phormii]
MNHSLGFCPPELTAKAAKLCPLFLRCIFYQRFVLVDAWPGSRRITATWDGMAWSDDIFFSFPSIPLQTQYADTLPKNPPTQKSEYSVGSNATNTTPQRSIHIHSHIAFSVCSFFSPPSFIFYVRTLYLVRKPLYKTSGQRGYEKGGHDGPKRPRINQ